MIDQATQLRKLVEQTGGSELHRTLSVPHSVPTGRVSFGPDAGRASATRAQGIARVEMARAIAVTSGKGGVGKSNIAVNLCVALSALGRRVCLVDGDLGTANADVLCNVTPRHSLDDVVHGRCRLGEALLDGPGGFKLLPGAAGIARMADLPADAQHRLLRRLAVLEDAVDHIVIDTGAGINRCVLGFVAASNQVLVVATPEPTSMTDAYGLIKTLVKRTDHARIAVLMNMARTEGEARDAFRRLQKVSKTFLETSLSYAGMLPDDDVVRQAVHRRVPFTMLAPGSPPSRAVVRVARGLVRASEGAVTEAQSMDRSGFVARLASWIAGRK